MVLKTFNISNATKRVVLSSFKSYFNAIDKNKTALKICLPKSKQKIKSFVSYEEYKTILNSFNLKLKTHKQKYLIVRILYETGIRANEIINIRKNDIKDHLIIIKGKGDKERIVYLSNELFLLTNQYLNDWSIFDKLFVFKYKNLHKKIANLSKIINKKISCHSFRRGFATYCINNKISILDISLIMGHNNLDTTKKYIYDYDYSKTMKKLF